MDQNIKKLIPYTKPYKSHIIWNVVFNILYALFSTLSMITMFPLLEVLFKKSEAVIKQPHYTGILNLGQYGKDWLFFTISDLNQKQGPQFALLLAVVLVIVTFLLKNLFNYLASYHITHLKNGVLRDLRQKMYYKIIDLPISYYSEKRKGDIMARMLGDVNEVQNSFFSILELIVKEPLTIVFTIIAMLNISVNLTLFVFVFIPVSGFIISKIGKSLKSKSTRAQQESGYFISWLKATMRRTNSKNDLTTLLIL
jgi:subfamily B ATP-binding cassette protein MsbA